MELPKKKRIETALQYIHGVGQTTARKILLSVGLENKTTAEISEPELTAIREELAKYRIEGELVGPARLLFHSCLCHLKSLPLFDESSGFWFSAVVFVP